MKKLIFKSSVILLVFILSLELNAQEKDSLTNLGEESIKLDSVIQQVKEELRQVSEQLERICESCYSQAVALTVSIENKSEIKGFFERIYETCPENIFYIKQYFYFLIKYKEYYPEAIIIGNKLLEMEGEKDIDEIQSKIKSMQGVLDEKNENK